MALAVTSLGMISSVGSGVLPACAALRAGLSQPRKIPYFTVLDEEEQVEIPLTGHPIHGFTEGFVGLGRWLRLAEAAVADMLEATSTPDAADVRFWQRTGLILVAPRLDGARYLEAEGDVRELKEAFAQQLAEVIGLPVRENELHVIDRGAGGAALAMQLAEQRLAAGAADRYLLLAVDSLLDTLSLEWLNDRERLKTRANPVGTMPGEAGVAALLETTAGARRRQAPPRAIIETAAFAQEPNHFFSDAVNTGAALAAVVRSAVTTALPGGGFEGDVHLDLNGEVWRASEWGHASARLAGVFGARVRLVLPASSLGDVGAAASLVGVAAAAQSFARGYAAGPRALVVASSEYGDVGAMLVRQEK